MTEIGFWHQYGLSLFCIAFPLLGLLWGWIATIRFDAKYNPNNSNLLVNEEKQRVVVDKKSEELATYIVGASPSGSATLGWGGGFGSGEDFYRGPIPLFGLKFDEKLAKRLFDIIIAATSLFLLFPLFAVIALIIWASDSRPPFFRHSRIGKNGQTFGLIKFRSMHVHADEILLQHLQSDAAAREEWFSTRRLHNDPRLTPIGKVLRRTSLDELPQLINVLHGDMSLVGPRPIVRAEVDRYGSAFSICFSVRPGITGLWQISGRSDTTYAERVTLDLDYIRTWSLSRDIVILARTVPAVLTERGAH